MKVFVDVGVSPDGYIAGPNRGPGNPLGDRKPSVITLAQAQTSSSPLATHIRYAITLR
jgi:hypothetical protein